MTLAFFSGASQTNGFGHRELKKSRNFPLHRQSQLKIQDAEK